MVDGDGVDGKVVSEECSITAKAGGVARVGVVLGVCFCQESGVIFLPRPYFVDFDQM
jgi:hypothetical protein